MIGRGHAGARCVRRKLYNLKGTRKEDIPSDVDKTARADCDKLKPLMKRRQVEHVSSIIMRRMKWGMTFHARGTCRQATYCNTVMLRPLRKDMWRLEETTPDIMESPQCVFSRFLASGKRTVSILSRKSVFGRTAPAATEVRMERICQQPAGTSLVHPGSPRPHQHPPLLSLVIGRSYAQSSGHGNVAVDGSKERRRAPYQDASVDPPPPELSPLGTTDVYQSNHLFVCKLLTC